MERVALWAPAKRSPFREDPGEELVLIERLEDRDQSRAGAEQPDERIAGGLGPRVVEPRRFSRQSVQRARAEGRAVAGRGIRGAKEKARVAGHVGSRGNGDLALAEDETVAEWNVVARPRAARRPLHPAVDGAP